MLLFLLYFLFFLLKNKKINTKCVPQTFPQHFFTGVIFDRLFEWGLFKRNDWTPNNQFDLDTIAIYTIHSMSCILKARYYHCCLFSYRTSSVMSQTTLPDTFYNRKKHFHESEIDCLDLVTHFAVFHPTDYLIASPSLKF